MKTRFLILFALVGFVLLITFTPDSEAMRVNWTLDQMIERSDVIAIGTIESTWIDVRPFDDYKIVDTAKIRVHEWLKNEKESDTIEIRHYGYWAQTTENFIGIHRMDTPTHRYESEQRVLVHLGYEKPTMVMGEGYYPFFEGSFVITDDIAISQAGEQMKLTELYDVIKTFVVDKPYKPSLEQLASVLRSCEQQRIAEATNYTMPDGRKYAIADVGFTYSNDTHIINNNICEWQTIEKYESDSALKNILDRCLQGNIGFTDEDFTRWNNETHYIDTDICLMIKESNPLWSQYLQNEN